VLTTKNVVFWDVAPCSSCVNQRFKHIASIFRVEKICEQGTSVSRWLQTELSAVNNQLYKDRKGGRVGHKEN
jgi:hypothetical protein